MDKYNFINVLLDDKKLTRIQKKRVMQLAFKEIRNESSKKSDIFQRVEEIEQKLNGLKVNRKTNEKSKNRPDHKPKETYDLLSQFSSEDGGIKNLTHSFNDGFIPYEKLMQKCKKEFEEGKNKFLNVPNALLTRIEHFAFKEKPKWYIRKGNKKIIYDLGWSEPNFVKWYKENQTHPANNASYNKKMILPFKETIQVRADLGNLPKMIEQLKRIVFGEKPSVNVKLHKSVHQAQFFTDVDQVGQALFNILDMIKYYSDKNFCDEVEINFKHTAEFKVLEIIHIDSKPTKSIKDKDFLGGNLKPIRTNLWGLCNFEIKANFDDGPYKKIILSDDKQELDKNIYELENHKIQGFTYVLKFY